MLATSLRVSFTIFNREKASDCCVNKCVPLQSLLGDCLAFKPKERPNFAEIGKRLAIMQAELAAGQPVTGLEQKEEAAVGKGRLFRDRATSLKVGRCL